MKRKLGRLATFVVLVTLVVALPFFAKLQSPNVWAATDVGSDVHAPSMSVDSGEEPITDPATTVAPDGDADLDSDTDYGNGTEDDSSSDTGDVEVVEDESEDVSILSSTEDKLLAIEAGASLVVLLGIVVYVTKRK